MYLEAPGTPQVAWAVSSGGLLCSLLLLQGGELLRQRDLGRLLADDLGPEVGKGGEDGGDIRFQHGWGTGELLFGHGMRDDAGNARKTKTLREELLKKQNKTLLFRQYTRLAGRGEEQERAVALWLSLIPRSRQRG